jgi:acyl carrier protein
VVEVAAVEDRPQMQGVLDRVRERFGGPDGVVHAAGIVRAGLMQAKSHELAQSVLSPKVDGTAVLFDVLEGTRPGFVVLFSSLAAILSPYAECDYSGANAFLDAFGSFANSAGSFRTITINWPGWREVGQLAELETLPGVEGWKAAALRDAIETKDGVEAFDRILASGHDRVIVCPQDLDRWLEKSRHVDPDVYLAHPNGARSGTRSDRKGLTPIERPATPVEERLARIWSEVLGVSELGRRENFFELGGHSLLAIRIVTQVRRAFDVDLSLRALFEAPTVADLGQYVEAVALSEAGSGPTRGGGNRVEIEI